MGLLDDAIRDHLELKRRHGADPSEVEQQEQEALGPARGDEAEAEPASAAAAAAYDREADDEYDPRPGDRVVETTDEEEPIYDEDLIGEDEDEDGAPADVEPRTRADAPVDEPRRSQPADDERPPRPRDDDQLQLAGADEQRSEDVLEETPEFLQETPEHERLWFEQKPPRDFDF
jgi:hypothetical protein